MEEVPKYVEGMIGYDQLNRGKTYYPGGTPWPLPGDDILTPKIPSIVPIQETTQFDIISKPKHYMLVEGVEVRDVCRALSDRMQDRYSAFFISDYIQFLQYVLRFDQKNGAEDLKKAKWYLEKLIDGDY